MSTRKREQRSRDTNLMLALVAIVVALIALIAFLGPGEASHSTRPSSYNAAPGGAKAAYLTLEALHRPVARWDRPLEDLAGLDAAHTTLLLLEPTYSALEKDRLAASIKAFLDRGGHVLTTGSEGALLLPGGSTKAGRRFGALCYTEPEGPGPLAAAGSVETYDPVRWGTEGPAVRIEQRCGPDAVAIRLPVGAGEAIWWSSPAPLTNTELRKDPDLRLFLASLGPDAAGHPRTVLFDETLEQSVRSKWTATHGLPLWWLLAQATVVFLLLVFSFSRRRGPLRLPVTLPRSSPVEFAVSMGDLYEKAGQTTAAVAAAHRRLERVLVREAGLAQTVIAAGPESVVRALEAKFGDIGGPWQPLGEHLAAAGKTADFPLRPGAALALVQALGADAARVQRAAQPQKQPAAPDAI